MDPLKIISFILTLILLGLFINEFITIMKKAVLYTFEALNVYNNEEMLAPTITLCPGPGWKSNGPFLNPDHLKRSAFSWEEVFHPLTLEALMNQSLFESRLTYTAYYGQCFTMTKLTPEKIADYSFQLVVNDSIGKKNMIGKC